MRAAALVLLLAACAPAPPAPETPPLSGACNADAAGALVGRAASAELGTEALRLTGARRLRWIRPGDMVTMDYSPQRLNIHLDAAGKVESLACG